MLYFSGLQDNHIPTVLGPNGNISNRIRTRRKKEKEKE